MQTDPTTRGKIITTICHPASLRPPRWKLAHTKVDFSVAISCDDNDLETKRLNERPSPHAKYGNLVASLQCNPQRLMAVAFLGADICSSFFFELSPTIVVLASLRSAPSVDEIALATEVLQRLLGCQYSWP